LINIGLREPAEYASVFSLCEGAVKTSLRNVALFRICVLHQIMDEVQIKCRDKNENQLFVYLRTYCTVDSNANYEATSSKEGKTYTKTKQAKLYNSNNSNNSIM
jgi:hypothetical protein